MKRVLLILSSLFLLSGCFNNANQDEKKEDSYYLDHPVVLNENDIIGERYYHQLPVKIYTKECIEFTYTSYGINPVELLVRTLPSGVNLKDVTSEDEFRYSSYGEGFYFLDLFDENNNRINMSCTTNANYNRLYTSEALPKGNLTLKVLMYNTGISAGDAYLSITTLDKREVEVYSDETTIKDVKPGDEINYLRNCDRLLCDAEFRFYFAYYEILNPETGSQIEHIYPLDYYELTLIDQDGEVEILSSEEDYYYTNKIYKERSKPKFRLTIKYLKVFEQDEVVLHFIYRNVA